MNKRIYGHIVVKPETHKLFVEVSKREGRDMMFLADMLIKNYLITINELGKSKNIISSSKRTRVIKR